MKLLAHSIRWFINDGIFKKIFVYILQGETDSGFFFKILVSNRILNHESATLPEITVYFYLLHPRYIFFKLPGFRSVLNECGSATLLAIIVLFAPFP
jgi:hypothetical protein